MILSFLKRFETTDVHTFHSSAKNKVVGPTENITENLLFLGCYTLLQTLSPKIDLANFMTSSVEYLEIIVGSKLVIDDEYLEMKVDEFFNENEDGI